MRNILITIGILLSLAITAGLLTEEVYARGSYPVRSGTTLYSSDFVYDTTYSYNLNYATHVSYSAYFTGCTNAILITYVQGKVGGVWATLQTNSDSTFSVGGYVLRDLDTNLIKGVEQIRFVNGKKANDSTAALLYYFQLLVQ